MYQQVAWDEDCRGFIDISYLNLCPYRYLPTAKMIAVIFCTHCAVQSCVNYVTVFGIIPKAHEKYSWPVLSEAKLCQLSFHAGRIFFFTGLITNS